MNWDDNDTRNIKRKLYESFHIVLEVAMKFFTRLYAGLSFEKLLVRALTAWLLSLSIQLEWVPHRFKDTAFLTQMRPGITILIGFAAFLFLTCVFTFYNNLSAEKVLLFGMAFLYSSRTFFDSNDFFYYLGVIAIMAVAAYYAFYDFDNPIILGKRVPIGVYIGLALFFILFVGGLTTLRYLSFRAPGFDFGVFTQMFYQMKTTLLPNTTVERDGFLSHFAVHISPIYYLILPFYALFTTPVTLQISQSVILTSGLIPVYLLCKHFHFSPAKTILIGVCYAFYPALSAGTFYDIHENAFLTPLILWVFYFLEKNNLWGIFIFALLTCMVKEDAPIYVTIIGLYAILGKRKVGIGTALMGMSIVYFLGALALLEQFGQGAMFYRYNNYNISDGGLTDVLKAVLANPAYVISQSMTEEKLFFVLRMMVPLGFLPLLNKDYTKYLLLVPLILINLMSNYTYQHSIDFQYVFGTAAFLIYITVSNLSGFSSKSARTILIFCCTASMLLFISHNTPRTNYVKDYIRDRDKIASLNLAVAAVPKDATVASSSFLVAHLYDRTELYELPTKHITEYVVFDFRYKTQGVEFSDYDNEDFERIYFDDGLVAVFKRR